MFTKAGSRGRRPLVADSRKQNGKKNMKYNNDLI